VNEIFRRYPFHNDLVAQAEPTLTAQVDNINAQITVIEKNIVDDKISQEERNRLLKQREEFIQQRETAKWNAYAKYLASKDKALATVVAKLVGARFDFAKLSVQDQQVILSFLVKDKLSDLIARKAPELL